MKKGSAKLIILLLSLLLAISTIGCNLTEGSHTSSSRPDAQTDSPPETTELPPKIVFTPPAANDLGSYEGYTFTILEAKDAADSLSDEANSASLLRVSEKLGAEIKITLSSAPAETVMTAQSSGERICDALNLPLTELSGLLRLGALEDLAALGLDPNTAGACRLSSESLAVNGKYYIAFSDISPRSVTATYAVRCNLSAALSNELYALFGKDVRAAALDGDFTLEKLLTAYADADLITASTSTDAVLSLASDNVESSARAFLAAMGGDIFSSHLSGIKLAFDDSESSFSDAYSNAQDIVADAGRDDSAVFTVEPFSEAQEQSCYLPLPKYDKSSDYRCYADPTLSYGWAVPLGAEYGKRTCDVTRVLFEASSASASAYFSAMTAGDTEAELARLIFSSRVFSLADLYDWGGFSAVVSRGILDGSSIDELMADAQFTKRLEAATAAIEIFLERLH